MKSAVTWTRPFVATAPKLDTSSSQMSDGSGTSNLDISKTMEPVTETLATKRKVDKTSR